MSKFYEYQRKKKFCWRWWVKEKYLLGGRSVPRSVGGWPEPEQREPGDRTAECPGVPQDPEAGPPAVPQSHPLQGQRV